MSDQKKNGVTTDEKPLVTLALFAYNQEKYIREGVEGAFSQTYSPLEIILSDDCSTDKTFQIMEEMARKYTGPHRLILNKNLQNLGIWKHVENICLSAGGEIVFAAAGDDISLGDRIIKCVPSFLDKSCNAITTDEIYISENGAILGNCYRSHLDNINLRLFLTNEYSLGCSWAVRKCLFVGFKETPSNVINEDVLLGVRALVTGHIKYLPVLTVKRRVGSGISTKKKPRSKALLSQVIDSREGLWSSVLATLSNSVNNGIEKSIARDKLRNSRAVKGLYFSFSISSLVEASRTIGVRQSMIELIRFYIAT